VLLCGAVLSAALVLSSGVVLPSTLMTILVP
jgi:hypothetical protein